MGSGSLGNVDTVQAIELSSWSPSFRSLGYRLVENSYLFLPCRAYTSLVAMNFPADSLSPDIMTKGQDGFEPIEPTESSEAGPPLCATTAAGMSREGLE